MSYRDRRLNKICNKAKIFKDKNESLLIIGLPDEPGGKMFKRFIKIHLDHVIENYKRGDVLRPLLENQNDSEESAIRKEPELEEKDESKLTYAMKEKHKIQLNRYVDKQELLKQNKMKIYKQMYSNCTLAMTTSLKTLKDYE